MLTSFRSEDGFFEVKMEVRIQW